MSEIRTEIAEFMSTPNKLYDMAEKYVVNRYNSSVFNQEEKETSEVIDAWAKEIGETGRDNDCEISEYIKRVIEDTTYNKPDALLSTMFDDGSIGEFDDEIIEKAPRNTLVAYDAAKGGTVDKSYIDHELLKPTWKHNQIETEIKYVDLRRNGYRTIANLSVMAKEALYNKKIKEVFSALDNAITGGDQVFNVTGGASALTKIVLDQLCLYCLDYAGDTDTPFAFGLNKYAQQIANMAGYTSYMSDSMKEDYNRYGLVKEYGGLLISGFSGARKASDGELLVPDKRIFGVAGKIGTLTDRGELRVYETPDNKREVIELKFTGYEYGINITKPEKVAKITFTA